MKRRITALLTILCMVLTMMPLHVHAEDTTYTVYLNQSSMGEGTVSGSGEYAVGETVTITATPAEGSCFYTWVVASGSASLSNASSQTTTFTMPAENMTITANFRYHVAGAYMNDANQHWTQCFLCSTLMSAKENHADADGNGLCDVCEYDLHTHNYSAATCTAPATCSCGATTGSVDSSNHVGGTEIRDAKDASEFESGYTGDTYCLGCNTKIASGTTIPATHTHNYAAATCTTPATCSCGDTTGGVDSTNHTGGTEIRDAKDATEFEAGYTGDTYCKGCGGKLSSGSTIPATHVHSYSTATCTTPATCSCGATTGGVDKSNHVGGTETRGYEAAGEFTDGYTGDTYCLGCGDLLSSGSVIPATHTHSWEWTYDSGMHWQVCDCGESSTAAQAHQFDNDTDATCDTCGYTREVHQHNFSTATCTTPATCSCGETTGDVDKSNHVGGTEIRNQVDAGEFTEGYTGDTYCKGCGDKLADGQTIPATHTHSYDSYAFDRNGHWKVCSCGDSLAAEDHDWYIYKKDANKHYWRCDCGNNGWGNDHFDNNDTGKCDDCGYEMHAHSYTAIVTAPTCSEQGYTTYTCSCNDSYVSDYVDALGHDWGDYISNGNGTHTQTCTTNSSHYQTESCKGSTATCKDLATCSECGATYGSLNSANHSGGTEVRNAKAATETENGYTGDTYCLGCGIKISEGVTIPATGSGDDDDDTHTHNYSYYKYDGTNHWKMCGCGQGQAGSVKAHTLVDEQNNNGHWKECTICNYYSDIQAHMYSNDSDANCNDCGYERHVHYNFYPATCTSPAKCSCQTIIGDKDPSNHVGGTEIRNAVEATWETEGYTGDTYCKGCGVKLESGKGIPMKGYVIVKIDDDVVVEDVTFTPGEGLVLPEDAVLVVDPHTPSEENIYFLLPPNTDTEYVSVASDNIALVTPFMLNGVTFYQYDVVVFGGEEFVVVGNTDDGLHLVSFSDGNSYFFDGEYLRLVDVAPRIDIEKRDNQKLNINGVTYDVVAALDGQASLDRLILYHNGKPAGQYHLTTGKATFNEGFDPEMLKAQQNVNDLGTVTPGESPIDGLEPGKTYNVSVIGSNDISVPGAENVNGTITQTFDIPNELVGRTDVTFVAVHNTNPHATALAAAKYKMEETMIDYWEYHGDSDEERQRLYEAANRAAMEWNIVQEHYNAWEKEHATDAGTGNELGTVTIAEDGKTLTATYTVNSFSPFTVYAFTEAELPEIKEFVTQPDGTLVRVVNEQPVATHTVASGENLTVIARKYGCTVDEIVALNSGLIENPSKIYVGWVLTIPEVK